MRIRIALIALLLAAGARAATISSNGSGGGLWYSSATWNGGTVPSSADAVTITAGDTVVIDGSTFASTTTVDGTLRFSSTTVTQMILVGGSITVGPTGTLTMGTAVSPVQSGQKATLVLAKGAVASQY